MRNFTRGGYRDFALHGGDRGETKALADVVHFKIGIVSQNLPLGHASGEHPEHGRHRDAQSPHAGDATHLIGIDSDALEVGRLHIWPLLIIAMPRPSSSASCGGGQCMTAGVQPGSGHEP